MTLAACGTEDSATTAGSAPSAVASSPAAAAVSSSPAPAATGATSDKELCESAKKAGQDMKAAFVAALQSGEEPTPATFKKILNDLDEKLTTVAAAGGDTKVVAALKQISAEAAKAAKAADPAAAADNPAFAKAGKDLSAACKAVGVNATF